MPGLSRRGFTGGLLTALAAARCSRKLAPRFAGLLYVLRSKQRALSIIDLAEFRWSGQIELPSPPAQLLRSGRSLFALCPDSSALYPLELERNRPGSPIRIPSPPRTALIRQSDPNIAMVACARELVAIDLKRRAVATKVALPGEPASIDDSQSAIAVAVPSRNVIVLLRGQSLSSPKMIDLGVPPRTVRFRKDGKTVLAGAWQEKQVIAVDAAADAVLARLPVPIAPERFCFNSDGGQMFVTGAGADVVTIVNPYQNEIDQTILGGRTPGAMVTTDNPGLLFVANPEAGDLTIIDIDTRHLSASVHVGQQPSFVSVTPDNEYVLVLNRKSGDLAVVRLKTVLDHKNKTKPLFTVVPVGTDPVSGIILPFPA